MFFFFGFFKKEKYYFDVNKKIELRYQNQSVMFLKLYVAFMKGKLW